MYIGGRHHNMLRRLLVLGMMGMASAVELTGVVHYVTVGKGYHKFEPNTTNANPGDIVSFQFYPTNHSVVKMDPSVPCKPYEMVDTTDADGGWWSGFKAMATFLNPPPTWNLTINDTTPIWYYCSAPQSCINYQMIGGINVDNSSYTISEVATEAGNAGYSLSPGESWEGDAMTKSAVSSPTGTSSSSSSTTSASSGSVTLSPGAIAGIAIGGIIALALIGLLFFFVGRKKKGAEVKATMVPDTPSPDMGEHPPVYQDPRYSQLPAGTGHWDQKAQQEEQARLAAGSHRISELPDTTTYDPVEIFTPGPEDMPAHRR